MSKMVDIPHSSFIPRESSGMMPTKVRRTRTFHVFGFVASALLLGSIVSAGAAYFLHRTAAQDLKKAEDMLGTQTQLFKLDDLGEVREFNRRLQAAEILLRNHIAPLKIFAALEDFTKQKVQFTSFSLDHTPSHEALIFLEGKTSEFRTLALQESSFAKDALLKNVSFKEVSTSEGEKSSEAGTVSGDRSIIFTLEGVLDTSLILYDGNTRPQARHTPFSENGDQIAVDNTQDFSSEPMILGESISTPSL